MIVEAAQDDLLNFRLTTRDDGEPAQLSGIGQAADFLLRHEGVETSVVFGIVNGDVVDGSLRTVSHTIDPDAFLKTLLGADSTGRHFGGGRRNKGGFRVPLGLFGRCRDREALWGSARTTVEDMISEKIGVGELTED